MSHRLTALCILIVAASVLAVGMGLAAPVPNETLETRCDAGKASSCALLAIRYRHGRGLPYDSARAYLYAQKGCKAGSSFACGYAGDMLYRGFGVAENKPEGERMMRLACAGGDRWSCDALRANGLAAPVADPVPLSGL